MASNTATRSPIQPQPPQSGLSIGGLLNSEWIKLRSLRSTMWCFLIVFVLSLLFSGFAAALTDSTDTHSQVVWLKAINVGLTFTPLVIASLGALIITGEYGTGMIKTTLSAAPKRLSSLFAKAAVFGATTFVVGFITSTAVAFEVIPFLAKKALAPDAGDPKAWLAILGGAAYLALVGLLALAIGTIVRNSAIAIATSLALFTVAPSAFILLYRLTGAPWSLSVYNLLPATLGGQIYAYPGSFEVFAAAGVLVPDAFQSLLLLVAWVVVSFTAASVLLKRRDV